MMGRPRIIDTQCQQRVIAVSITLHLGQETPNVAIPTLGITDSEKAGGKARGSVKDLSGKITSS